MLVGGKVHDITGREQTILFCFILYIYIRNYSYLEYAGIQSCPLIGKNRYIEYVLFLEYFRRSILEDPIPKNSAPPKTLGSHHGSPWFFPLQSQT